MNFRFESWVLPDYEKNSSDSPLSKRKFGTIVEKNNKYKIITSISINIIFTSTL